MIPYNAGAFIYLAVYTLSFPRRLEFRSAVVFNASSPPAPPPHQKNVIRTNHVLSVYFVIVKMSEGEENAIESRD
jgi:hypothetical protein